MTEWFEEWFGEEYLHLYPHRDEADAERLVDLLCAALPWQPGWRVLDVGCGAGRHMAALEARGVRPIGVDLSLMLLRRVHEVTDRPVVRADMRVLPIRPRSMDLTVNLFTSFGYFEQDAEHAATLGQMLGTVRPGGWFALDFLSAELVQRRLVPAETAQFEDRAVQITRAITDNGRFVVKTIQTPDGRQFRERVRLFTPPELENMIQAHGATVVHRWGDYAGAELGAGPRCILLATVAG
jgi:SAM-dependent methyltransferase